MVAPLPVREYASEAEMRARYAALHRATFAHRDVEAKAPAFQDRPAIARDFGPIPPPDIEVTREAYRQAQEAMAEGRRAHLADRKSLTDCLRITCAVTGFSADDIKGSRRFTDVVKARQIAMFLMARLGKRSAPETGRFLGGRDHTTVLHGVRRVDAILRAHRITDLSDPLKIAQRLWEADWTEAAR